MFNTYLLISSLQLPFPCENYAEICMRTIGVDPAFSDTKTKKNTISRDMLIEVLIDGTAYLQITFKTDRNNAQ